MKRLFLFLLAALFVFAAGCACHQGSPLVQTQVRGQYDVTFGYCR